MSNLQVQELVKDTAAISRQKLFASPELDRCLINLGDRTEEFFPLFPQEGRQAFRDHDAFLETHQNRYDDLLFALETLCTKLELVEGAIEQTLPLVRRGRLIQQALRFWMETPDAAYVYWTERRGRGLHLQATPIDVSQTLATHLIERVATVILTSATLTVAGEFDYTQKRLGLQNARTLAIESHYNYAKQALLYVPPQLPDPRQPDFARHAADEIEKLLNASRGRAFVLFTSYQQMRQVCELLRKRIEYPVLLQGDAPRNALLEGFRATPGAVLFGTSSF